MKPLRSVFVVLALGILPAVATAQVRPLVAVSFDLAVPRWQDHFGGERPAFEKQAAARIANWLGERVGFVSFDSEATSTHKLAVHLEPMPDTATKFYKETQLRLELIGPGSAAPLVWRFRPEDTYAQPIGGGPGLLKELEMRLEDINRPALVRQVLSQVSIAKEAQLWKNPVGWIIPYRKAELCMDLSSVVRIVSMMPTDAGPQQKIFRARASGDFAPKDSTLPATWIGRLFTVPEKPVLADESEAAADALGAVNPQQVAIRAIYVLDYQRLQPCVDSASPEAVDFRGGVR